MQFVFWDRLLCSVLTSAIEKQLWIVYWIHYCIGYHEVEGHNPRVCVSILRTVSTPSLEETSLIRPFQGNQLSLNQLVLAKVTELPRTKFHFSDQGDVRKCESCSEIHVEHDDDLCTENWLPPTHFIQCCILYAKYQPGSNTTPGSAVVLAS